MTTNDNNDINRQAMTELVRQALDDMLPQVLAEVLPLADTASSTPADAEADQVLCRAHGEYHPMIEFRTFDGRPLPSCIVASNQVNRLVLSAIGRRPRSKQRLRLAHIAEAAILARIKDDDITGLLSACFDLIIKLHGDEDDADNDV